MDDFVSSRECNLHGIDYPLKTFTLKIETHMSKQTLGKGLVVLGAGLSFLFSVGLWFSGQREEGLFVGIWVPSVLSFGTLLFAGRGAAS